MNPVMGALDPDFVLQQRDATALLSEHWGLLPAMFAAQVFGTPDLAEVVKRIFKDAGVDGQNTSASPDSSTTAPQSAPPTTVAADAAAFPSITSVPLGLVLTYLRSRGMDTSHVLGHDLIARDDEAERKSMSVPPAPNRSQLRFGQKTTAFLLAGAYGTNVDLALFERTRHHAPRHYFNVKRVDRNLADPVRRRIKDLEKPLSDVVVPRPP